MKLLTNKTYVTATNNWYAPTCEFHEKHPSIKRFEFIDQTSSAGDWNGFFIQRTGKYTAQAIGFEQVNNHPHDGFTLYTAEHPFFKCDLRKPDYAENARLCYLQCTPILN